MDNVSTPNTKMRLAAAATTYGVSVSTLRRRIAEGLIPAYRIGPRIIAVDPAEVEAAFERINSEA